MHTAFVILLTIVPVSTNCTAALILARGGSKGIRLKNLKEVGGISLLARSILLAKQAGFTDITVSTDHPLLALEAIKYNVNLYKRSFVTATDWAPSIWGAAEFIEFRPDIRVLTLIQPTSPLVNAKSLRYAIQKLGSPIQFDCIFSVNRSFKLRWSYSDIKPLNFVSNRRPRRQDWDGELVENGAFYITRAELIQNGYLQNNNCTVWEVSQLEGIEIDSHFDIALANILIKQLGNL